MFQTLKEMKLKQTSILEEIKRIKLQDMFIITLLGALATAVSMTSNGWLISSIIIAIALMVWEDKYATRIAGFSTVVYIIISPNVLDALVYTLVFVIIFYTLMISFILISYKLNLRNKLWIEENKNFSLEILTLSEHFSDLLKTNDFLKNEFLERYLIRFIEVRLKTEDYVLNISTSFYGQKEGNNISEKFEYLILSFLSKKSQIDEDEEDMLFLELLEESDFDLFIKVISRIAKTGNRIEILIERYKSDILLKAQTVYNGDEMIKEFKW